ncbi:MAG TPA: hypothetical protein PLI45_04675 [Candidatus Woesebacteria bacterium]|nr:hypothetical protein [Candidatus Woesebacteria bacterium]
MDTNQFRESVNKSQLTNETKEKIYRLLEDTNNPNSWEQIKELIIFEAKELMSLTDRKEEMEDTDMYKTDEAEQTIETPAEPVVEQQPVELVTAPVWETPVQETPVPATPAWNQPSQQTTEPVPATPAWSQPAEPVQQTTEEPVEQSTPQWDQMAEQPVPPASPAPFPGNDQNQV